MALLAISDLHIGFEPNRRALEAVAARPGDWLIIAGDVGETTTHLAYALECLSPKFARLIWVPGNHELWSRREEPALRGESKYRALIAVCRERGVLTPEDPYPLYESAGGLLRIAPVFTLYDYSFTPTPMEPAAALQWAMDQGVLCSDEAVLHCAPHASRAAWCASRCDETELRLTRTRANDTCPLVLVGHFPFLREHAELVAYPAFSIWCGTERTRTWPRRFGASVVVYGHVHMPGTRHADGIRYEEVSLGYPGQWSTSQGLDAHFRVIAR